MTNSTSLQIYATDSDGKRITTTISDCNPQATNQTLLTFAQMLNSSLTTNTYTETVKVTRELLDVGGNN